MSLGATPSPFTLTPAQSTTPAPASRSESSTSSVEADRSRSDPPSREPTSSRSTPLPGLSSTAAPLTPLSPNSPSDSESDRETWEYRGHILTASALSLVLQQEKLALADSSGQYAGDVDWDNLRQAWIPVWAEKLHAWDVAEGEVPDVDPMNYQVKRKDDWGNRVAWRDGQM